MKILLIGHSVEDRVHMHGEDFIKPGGIFYSASAIQSFKEADDVFYLATAIADENYYLFSSLYEQLDKKYFQYAEKIPKVNLTLCMHEERKEKYENISQSLNLNVSDFSIFDGILINMITGFDVSLEQVKNIRNSFNGLIYLDVHTLSRGLDENMMRNFRKIPDFKEWAASADIIQVNQQEVFTLYDKKSEHEIAAEILNSGVKFLIVTKEETGARLYFLKDNELVSVLKTSIKIDTGNKIGCGDVFGAVFFYSYIKNNNELEALEIANTAAGYTASYKDIKEFGNLKNDVFSRYN